MEDGQVACMPELLRMVHSLSAKLRELAVQQMADLIKNDTVVLARIVAAANSIGYNPGYVEITSINEAIQIIGFSRVRSLTMSLILLESTSMWQYTEERRQATLVSLVSGLIAEQMANYHGGAQADAAFLVGALRGYGRIALATYCVERYKAADKVAETLGEEMAFRQEFGLSPVELAHELMQAVHMSPELLKALRPYAPDKKGGQHENAVQVLTGLSDFGYMLAHAAVDPELAEAQFAKLKGSLAQRYKDVMPEDTAWIDDILGAARSHLRALSVGTGQKAYSDGVADLLLRRVEHREPHKAEAKPLRSIHAVLAQDSGNALQRGLTQMEGYIKQGRGLDAEVGGALLGALKAGFDAQEGWIFLKRAGQDSFVLEHGLGTYSFLVKGRARVRLDDNTVFGLCLRRRETIFIHDAREARMRAYLPQWYRDNIQLESFVLFCLRTQMRVLGLIYVGWKQANAIKIEARHTALLKKLLSAFESMG